MLQIKTLSKYNFTVKNKKNLQMENMTKRQYEGFLTFNLTTQDEFGSIGGNNAGRQFVFISDETVIRSNTILHGDNQCQGLL